MFINYWLQISEFHKKKIYIFLSENSPIQLTTQKIGIDASVAIFVCLIGLFEVFTYCLYGDKTTSNYEGLAEDLYEKNWYELPNQIKKYFLIMIMSAQKPVYYHGMHLTVLELTVFTKVFFIELVD